MIVFGEGPIRFIGFIYLMGPIFMAVFGFIFFGFIRPFGGIPCTWGFSP